MRNILITGVAGLIGSHLSDSLLPKFNKIIGVDNLSFGNINNLSQSMKYKTFDFVYQDVKSKEFLDHENIDYIFHLAAYKKAPGGTINSSEVMKNNIEMMHNVIELAQKNNAYVIFSSTSDIYGNSKTFDEDESILIGPPTIERYSYALSKLYEEQYLLNLIKEGKIKGTIVRIFGCFSERSNRNWSGGHVPIFIDNALRNDDIIIYGNGEQTRSMSYVYDIIEGLSLVYQKSKLSKHLNGQIINLGSNEEMSVVDCAKLIIKQTNSKSKIKYLNPEKIYGKYKEIDRRFANLEKAKRLLNYDCSVDSMNVGIKKVIKIWRIN